jgi:hypothetical protein
VIQTIPIASPTPLEELNRALVLFGGGARRECAEILTALRLYINFARIQSVLATRQFSDHIDSKTNPMPRPQSAEWQNEW